MKAIIHSVVIKIKEPFIKMIPIPEPELLVGTGSIKLAVRSLKDKNCRRPMIVTDKQLISLGLLDDLLAALDISEFESVVFEDVTPDPDFKLVRLGVDLFNRNNCDSVIAVGGGSPMDCAKSILASAATKKDISKLTGLLKVHKRLPPLIAIPTTAGTGSEGTVAAVVSDKETRKKFAIADISIVPKVAILDAELMLNLPPNISAETGIDALTHAIESYTALYANKKTKELSIDAIQRIFKHLPVLCRPKEQQGLSDTELLTARESIAIASYKAGRAFTQTYVGYVHAIAHQLGGYYHVPHGLANAIMLPLVLECNFEQAKQKYAALSQALNFSSSTDSTELAARTFIDQLKQLLTDLSIPTFVAELREDDIPLLAKRACDEAFCTYPVPKFITEKQCQELLRQVLSK